VKTRGVFWHLVLAARVYFLGGGVIVYSLGATVAWHEAGVLSVVPLLLGLLTGLLVQLMTNYLNEYWDGAGDALIHQRTLFSGGSGILSAGVLSARTLYLAAMSCAQGAVLLTVVLGFVTHLSWFSLLVIALTLLGGMAYSQPPLRLVARGVGEFSAAVIVGFLAPLVAYSLQLGFPSPLFVGVCLSAVIMQFAMLLAIEFPDYEADRATAKGNLVVRLGPRRAARLHAVALLAVYVASIVGLAFGLPRPAALLPVAELPVAIFQIGVVRSFVGGDKTRMPLLTFLAVALFAVFCVLQIVGLILR
jgi:1,4-dihydroxy-2-naphthoate polyprenyltransferase